MVKCVKNWTYNYTGFMLHDIVFFEFGWLKVLFLSMNAKRYT